MERERQMPATLASSKARIQLSLAVGQGPMATQQTHTAIEGHRQTFDITRASIANEMANLQTMCRSAGRNTPDQPAAPDHIEWNATCMQALDAGHHLQTLIDAVAQGYQHVEAVYQRETEAQRQIEGVKQRVSSR